MTTDQEQRDRLISQTSITACTRCGRTVEQVVPGARCRHDPMGEHKWWTGTRREWFAR
ncbi:MAG TPA: hypothetical protein VF317_12840 [Dermatophilaceae bacterium]